MLWGTLNDRNGLTYQCMCLQHILKGSDRERFRCFPMSMSRHFRMGIGCKCPKDRPYDCLCHGNRSDRKTEITNIYQKLPNNFDS